MEQSIARAKALSSPVRVKILKLLKQRSHTLTEVSNALGISKTNAKVHLKKLLDAGIIAEKPRSKWKYYSLVEKDSGLVTFSIPIVALFLSLVSLYSAFQNTIRIVSPDHEYSIFFSFTPLGWLYLYTALILGVVFLASLLWFAFLRTKSKR